MEIYVVFIQSEMRICKILCQILTSTNVTTMYQMSQFNGWHPCFILWFKFQPREKLSYGFSRSLQVNSRIVLELGHALFHPNSFQFTIH
jgi:hypothetical protein